MPGARHRENVLLVEGKDDCYAVAGLMGHHIQWGKSADEWPVLIQECDGVENLLASQTIRTWLKASGLRRLGLLVDANEQFENRWQSVRNACIPSFSGIPETLPAEGLIAQKEAGIRLGVWIMPDNRSRGMLETLLAFLVQEPDGGLWSWTQKALDQARALGAPCKPAHLDKAKVHTWLAWQDPPGQPLGQALLSRCLDPNSPRAASFVKWFRDLYQL